MITGRKALTAVAALPAAAVVIIPKKAPAAPDPVPRLYAQYLQADYCAKVARDWAEDIGEAAHFHSPAYSGADKEANALSGVSLDGLYEVSEARATTLDGALCHAKIALDGIECEHPDPDYDGWDLSAALNLCATLEALAGGAA